jgi:hypothetical protein
MGLENISLPSQAKRLSLRRLAFGSASLMLSLVFFFWSGPTAAQAPLARDVLILSDVGMSHSLTAEVTQQIVAGVRETPDATSSFTLRVSICRHFQARLRQKTHGIGWLRNMATINWT